MPAERFVKALNDQVANEFAASHQYVAIGAHLRVADASAARALLLCAGVEERGHAMMMIKYLLDTDAPVMLREVAAPAS